MNLKNNNQLHFEPVNSENRREAENLSVFSEQSGFIESVGECLQEADNLNLWRPVCIYDGDTLVLQCTAIFLPLFRDGYGWIGC